MRLGGCEKRILKACRLQAPNPQNAFRELSKTHFEDLQVLRPEPAEMHVEGSEKHILKVCRL